VCVYIYIYIYIYIYVYIYVCMYMYIVYGQVILNYPLSRIISTKCCIHTVVPPDDGPRYARNM